METLTRDPVEARAVRDSIHPATWDPLEAWVSTQSQPGLRAVPAVARREKCHRQTEPQIQQSDADVDRPCGSRDSGGGSRLPTCGAGANSKEPASPVQVVHRQTPRPDQPAVESARVARLMFSGRWMILNAKLRRRSRK